MRKGLLPQKKTELLPQILYVEVLPGLSLRVDCIAAWMTDFGKATSKKMRASVEKRGASPERANIAIIPWCKPMKPLLHRSEVSPRSNRAPRLTLICILALMSFCACSGRAQDDPLNKVHVPPPTTTTPTVGAPAGVDAPITVGPASGKAKPGSLIRMNVDMVLVPVTVTDPMNRLVTGLEQEDFTVFENNGSQKIKSFAAEDAPVSIGIIFDLSGSMNSKLIRARESILQFAKTANPEDEFFVIGFNDRPELIEDFTNSVEEIQARLATVRSGHRTALLDAIYYGVAKMKEAKHERKALLVVSDGGDNRSRYTEGEVRAQVRESDVEIYSIGIFDPYAATPEERTGPILLNELCEETGGRLFRVDDISEMSDIAEKISTELRNQYVIGYTPKNISRDGKWRKVKVKLTPPSGLPPLTVHARTGYYAPLQ
jgi:Ca-activated chloride channel homolog